MAICIGAQYIQWFDTYAGKFFKISSRDEKPYICGERCWQLRCEYLHQNKGFLNTEKDEAVRFHLGVNCGTSVCQLDMQKKQEGVTEIRIDIEQFCFRMCQAARNYYHEAYKEKDFRLYSVIVISVAVMTMLLMKIKKNQKELDELRKNMKKAQMDYQQLKDKINENGNVIHLYAALSEEEAKTEMLKEKQREIRKQAELLLKE